MHKGYQVNFFNLAAAITQPWNSKSTIEFRLHESTINAREIEMWVKFALPSAELPNARQTS